VLWWRVPFLQQQRRGGDQNLPQQVGLERIEGEGEGGKEGGGAPDRGGVGGGEGALGLLQLLLVVVVV